MKKKLSAALAAVLAFLAPRSAEAEVAAAAAASKGMYTGAGVSLVGGTALSSDLLGWAGFVVAVAGFALNAWFKWDARRRAKREHTARMQRILGGHRTDTDLLPLGEDD
ncbi:MAG: hypothetical protein DI587_39275 [Variovorax paradoxus]|jgi:hypothetical protein|nr:MAG: hypothetical protein DI583_39275 [Variovorax paradoxus]PZP98720.1 MAG: hypothetical protein DI587_39275 [Variovorax paradoxus]